MCSGIELALEVAAEARSPSDAARSRGSRTPRRAAPAEERSGARAWSRLRPRRGTRRWSPARAPSRCGSCRPESAATTVTFWVPARRTRVATSARPDHGPRWNTATTGRGLRSAITWIARTWSCSVMGLATFTRIGTELPFSAICGSSMSTPPGSRRRAAGDLRHEGRDVVHLLRERAAAPPTAASAPVSARKRRRFIAASRARPRGPPPAGP